MSYFCYRDPVSFVASVAMALTMSALSAKIVVRVRRRERLLKVVRTLSAEIRVLSDKRRMLERQAARKRLGQDTRGRKQRFVGRCKACCMRWLNEPGGPAHETKLCLATKRWLKRGGLQR